MRKKEFKMMVATNPALYQWLKENSLWIKSRPEIMMYLTQHPDAMKHFRSGQPIDNEKIFHNSKLFMNERMKERMERKNRRADQAKEKAPKEKGKKGGLLSNLKSMFNKAPAVVPASTQLPVIQHPGRPMNRISAGTPHSVQPNPTSNPKSKPTPPLAFKIPKIKLNRKKLMSTLNQTTEMLDVVGALIGKVSNIK